MFYRQKVLLALIEVFGGKLSHTDLEKHLFLFCQSSGRNHYDFFPYHFGAFSFTSYEDKRKLVERGLLEDCDSFKLAPSISYIGKLTPTDRQALRAYFRHQGKLGGKELVRKTYLEYPEYSARSEIAERIFTTDEYIVAEKKWRSDTDGVLMTLGYEGITIDQYIAKLIFNNVTQLVDVRQNPYSRKHGFSQKQLRGYVQKAGIQYAHLPELGIPSNLRKNLDAPADYELLFEHYADHILPGQYEAVANILEWVRKGQRVALTCFEAEHSMCHRHKITDLIARDERCNFRIIHL